MISKSGDFEMRLNIWCTLLCTCICLFSPCHVLLFFSARFFSSSSQTRWGAKETGLKCVDRNI